MSPFYLFITSSLLPLPSVWNLTPAPGFVLSYIALLDTSSPLPYLLHPFTHTHTHTHTHTPFSSSLTSLYLPSFFLAIHSSPLNIHLLSSFLPFLLSSLPSPPLPPLTVLYSSFFPTNLLPFFHYFSLFFLRLPLHLLLLLPLFFFLLQRRA